MQKIGGVGPSGTHSPSDIALITLGSSDSKVLTIIPADLAKLNEQSRKHL
jgi:hypothetical protein